MKSIKVYEIIKACSGTYIGDEGLLGMEISSIDTDSRNMSAGSLFIPIAGENFDGHNFIEKAFEGGAALTLSEKDVKGRPYIKVESTFQALKDIAEYYRSLFDVKVIAVTGSVGKTTTKEMIYSVLSQKYNVLKSEKNFNNEIGVPQTLFNLTDEHEIAVIEMGMNHFGEIERLSKTARPDICVITNIGHSHVGHLESREGIFKAKTEIFSYMKEDGTAVLNGDDDLLYKLNGRKMNTMFFGFNSYNDAAISSYTAKGFEGADAAIIHEDEKFEFSILSPGRHMAYACAAAYCVGKLLDLNDEQIRRGILEFEPVGRRMEIEDTGRITILNDVYNASPESVKAAIDVLCLAKGRKVCVLGDMLELGGMSSRLHMDIGEYAAKMGVDMVLCTGQASHCTSEGADDKGAYSVWFESQSEMIESLGKYIKDGDTVLVKASRGMHFEESVEALKKI